MNAFLEENIVSASSYCLKTKKFVGELVKAIIGYQPRIHAELGPTSQGYYTHGCPLRTKNNLVVAPDSNGCMTVNVALCEKQHEPKLEKFFREVIRLLLRLGVRASDIDNVTIYTICYDYLAGMGRHGDSPSKEDEDGLGCRLILRYGGKQKVDFTAHKFTEADEKAKEKVDGVSFTLDADAGMHIYLTTPFGNGKLPLCWTDKEKKVGIQAQHAVERIGLGEERACIFVIDFVLPSMRVMKNALSIIKNERFKFDLNDY